MKKIVLLLIVIPPLIFAAVFLFVLYEGPRMTIQHHFRTYQMEMPPQPAGTATVTPPETLPPAAELARLKNPLQATPENLAAGGVYYTYYCIFCHGDGGAGDGPVGYSYIPRPADLRTNKVKGYSDPDLLNAMLNGVGHAPVLQTVVPPEHRWYLVLFVRSLGENRKGVSRGSHLITSDKI